MNARRNILEALYYTAVHWDTFMITGNYKLEKCTMRVSKKKKVIRAKTKGVD